MLTTPQLRQAWAPACNVPLARVEIVQGVRVQCHEKVASAVQALGRVFERHQYTVRASDTGAYNCRAITGGTEHSLHAFGIALDVNWNTNPYRADNRLVTDMPKAMTDDVKAIRTLSGARLWAWGGDYRSVKDAMHFEVCCSPDDLAGGIDWDTVKQPTLRRNTPHKWPLIRRGDRGPAVKKLHDLLDVARAGDAGYGTFGPKTESAVKAYQKSRGLEPDGRVGRQTWTALLTAQPPVAANEPGPVKRQITAPAASTEPVTVWL